MLVSNKIIHHQNGFTLIELLVVMIIITILSSAFLPNFLDISKRRSDLIISEMWTIAQAIQTYDAQIGDFPDASNNCANAIDVLTSNAFIAGVSTATGGTPWGSDARYITACSGSSANLMTLEIETDEQWAPYIANGLPASTSTISTTHGTATLNISKLAYIPVLERFLYLDQSATSTTSASGTYETDGDIRMASPTDIILLNRDTINAVSIAVSTTLSRAVFYQDLVSMPATITKPTCISPATANIVHSLSAIDGNFNSPTASFSWIISTVNQVDTWLLSINNNGSDLTIDNATASISVNCQ